MYRISILPLRFFKPAHSMSTTRTSAVLSVITAKKANESLTDKVILEKDGAMREEFLQKFQLGADIPQSYALLYSHTPKTIDAIKSMLEPRKVNYPSTVLIILAVAIRERLLLDIANEEKRSNALKKIAVHPAVTAEAAFCGHSGFSMEMEIQNAVYLAQYHIAPKATSSDYLELEAPCCRLL